MEEDLIALADAPSPLSSTGGSPPPSVSVGEKDNRDIEDMELSDVEETETPAIIGTIAPLLCYIWHSACFSSMILHFFWK